MVKIPLKLAIMGTRGIPANYGGFETFAEELSAILASRGHDVTVYGRSHYVRNNFQFYKGVRLVVLPSLRFKYLDTVFNSILSASHGFTKGYDAVLMCNAANSFACIIPRLAGSKVLINVDGLEWKRKKWNMLGRWWYLIGERLATIFANRIVSDAQVIQDYYKKRYGADSLFIPYGAPDKKTVGLSAVKKFGLKTDGYLLYVSRLEPENNAHVVIDAYRRVETDIPLVIVGDAPYNREYIRRLKKAADKRVIFTGFMFGEGYLQLQSNCYAYIQATEVGGTHPALIEGMGMANAVIANDTPENREAAGDGALFYRRNDPSSLAETMKIILDKPDMREALRQNALQTVCRKYNWSHVADLYEKAFYDIIGPGMDRC